MTEQQPTETSESAGQVAAKKATGQAVEQRAGKQAGAQQEASKEAAGQPAAQQATDQLDARQQKPSPVKASFIAAIPIMLGYVALGIPCGVLAQHADMNVIMVILLSALFYSGTGQYMFSSLYLAGSGILGIAAPIALVCSRQLLYASALIPYLRNIPKGTAYSFAAGVTDESFAVNMRQFEQESWTVVQARWVNLFSQSSWALSNVVGFVLSGFISVDTAIASFAMTSIFICLLFTQKANVEKVAAGVAAALGVIICKLVGLSGPAIFIGAVVGVVTGVLMKSLHEKRNRSGAAPAAGEGA